MDKTTILSAHRYVFHKRSGKHTEYALDSVIQGKCLLPYKIRVESSLATPDNLIVQFFDTPKWHNCKSIELSRCPKKPYLFIGERSIKIWSIPIALHCYENLNIVRIDVLTPPAGQRS